MSHKLEVLCAVQAIMWGFWIGNPWWQSFAVSQAYVWMNALAPEWIWGWGVGLLGLAQLIAVWRRRLRWRYALALLGIFVWILIAVAFALGNWRSTAMLNSSFFALAQALNYVELETWRRCRNDHGGEYDSFS